MKKISWEKVGVWAGVIGLFALLKESKPKAETTTEAAPAEATVQGLSGVKRKRKKIAKRKSKK